MAETRLKVGDKFDPPAEILAGGVTGVLGKRGRGKSGYVKRLMEELSRVGIPYVAFDPAGVLWGIRSNVDGKGEGYPVLIIGGDHADIPFDRAKGGAVAHKIVELNINVIIDIKAQSADTYRTFVTDFCNTLFNINDTLRHVILEEAPDLVPQKLWPDQKKCYASVERLVRVGRNQDIGVTLVSQRAATVNKDVLTQVDALVVFGVLSPQDRKALREWVEENAEAEALDEFIHGLAALKPREAWIWWPERDWFKRFRTTDMVTFHADRSNLRRRGLMQMRPVCTDMKAVAQRLSESLKLPIVDEKDFAALNAALNNARHEAETLRKRLTAAEQSAGRVDPAALQALQAAVVAAEREARNRAGRILSALRMARSSPVATLGPALDAAIREAEEASTAKPTPPPIVVPFQLPTNARIVQTPSVEFASMSSEEGANAPGQTGPGQRVLRAIKRLNNLGMRRPSRDRTAIWAGYTPNTGTINTVFSRLKGAGLIAYEGAGLLLTPIGEAEAGDVPPVLGTEELHGQVQGMIAKPLWKLLKVLLDAHPQSVPRESLAESAGYTPNTGTFNTLISRLRGMGLAETGDGGEKATDILFLGSEAIK